MRILIHAINFHPEMVGAGKYTAEMAFWLADRGHDVRTVVPPPYNPQWRVWPGYRAWKYEREHIRVSQATHRRDEGDSTIVNVIRCPVWVPRDPSGPRRLLHLLSFALSSLPAMLAQLRWRPDVVLVIEPSLSCAPVSLVVARFVRARTWLHVQDFEVEAAFAIGGLSKWRTLRSWAGWLEQQLSRRFDVVSTISERMLERLALKRIDHPILFSNWVDTEAICPALECSPFRRELGIASDVTVALYSGSMGRKQGMELVTESALRLADRRNLLFVICGDGPMRPYVTEKLARQPNVRFLPLQSPSRLNELLNLADIHLLPQSGDAADLVLPSKLTGMLASGRPIVAAAQAGTQIASIVSEKGIVVPPENVEAFVNAILFLKANPDVGARLGSVGRQYAIEHLDKHKVLLAFERALLLLRGNQAENGPGSEPTNAHVPIVPVPAEGAVGARGKAIYRQ